MKRATFAFMAVLVSADFGGRFAFSAALSGVTIGVTACVALTCVVIAGHEPRRA